MTINRPASGWNLGGVSTHPGERLSEEFLKPLGISQDALQGRSEYRQRASAKLSTASAQSHQIQRLV